VTAIGADDAGKQELDISVFARADLVIADSLEQCLKYGDLAHAHSTLQSKPIFELGALVKSAIKRKNSWITVADLTGIAIEDLQIAKMIYNRLTNA